MSIAQDALSFDDVTDSASKRQTIDVLALSCVKGLGDDGIAHVLAQVRRNGGDLADFYGASRERLRSHYRLRDSAAILVRTQADQLREQAAKLLARLGDLGIVVLVPGDSRYPKGLHDFYGGEPPLLYARGNVRLLDTPCVAILNSALPTSQALELTLGISSRLAEADRTLLIGTEAPAYNVVGLACKRAAGNRVVVLHEGLLYASAERPERELVPLARSIGESFDRQHALLVSPFRLDGRWQKGNGQRRDRLIAGLAETVVAIEIKGGGTMESLCREALDRGRRVFACQYSEPPYGGCVNKALIERGAVPFVGDSIGSNVRLLLAREATPPISASDPGDHLERRRYLGQFFTPPEVAQFMLTTVEIIRGKRLAPAAKIIDPACGEGVFLRVLAQRDCRPANLFGVDIDETLLPGWRSDSQLRGARLFCSNGLLDNASIGVVGSSFDLTVGNPPFSGRGLKDLLRLVSPPSDDRTEPERTLFVADFSIKKANGNGDLLSHHDRAILDHVARHLSRYVCWRLRDEIDPAAEIDLDSTVATGGLFGELNLRERPVRASDYEKMARLIAGWPPDRPLDTTRPDVRDTLRRLAATAIEVFFTERFVQLAKPGGMIAIIVPESILASDQLSAFRSWLLEQVQLLAVIALPQKVFSGVGANAKTGVLFARKYTAAELVSNSKAPDIAPGCRLSPELRMANVAMVSPNIDHESCSLATYLADVLARMRDEQQTGLWRRAAIHG